MCALQESAPSLGEVTIGNARLVMWMHLLRIAAALGHCDWQRWQGLQHQLVSGFRSHGAIVDVQALHGAQEHVHTLLPSSTTSLSCRASVGGVFSTSMKRKGELVACIEQGYLRLAHVNILLQVINGSKMSRSKQKEVSRELTGMLVGECKLRPQFASVLLSAMGDDVLDRARELLDPPASPDVSAISPCLRREVSALKLLPSGVLDIASQKVAIAVARLAATLGIRNVVGSRGVHISPGTAEKGESLQNELLREVRSYASDDTIKAVDVLSAVRDFICHESLEQAKQDTGVLELDVIMGLLSVVVTG